MLLLPIKWNWWSPTASIYPGFRPNLANQPTFWIGGMVNRTTCPVMLVKHDVTHKPVLFLLNLVWMQPLWECRRYLLISLSIFVIRYMYLSVQCNKVSTLTLVSIPCLKVKIMKKECELNVFPSSSWSEITRLVLSKDRGISNKPKHGRDVEGVEFTNWKQQGVNSSQLDKFKTWRGPCKIFTELFMIYLIQLCFRCSTGHV